MKYKKNIHARISVKPNDPHMKNALRKMAFDASIVRGKEVSMSDIVRETIENNPEYQIALQSVSNVAEAA